LNYINIRVHVSILQEKGILRLRAHFLASCGRTMTGTKGPFLLCSIIPGFYGFIQCVKKAAIHSTVFKRMVEEKMYCGSLVVNQAMGMLTVIC